MSEHTITTEAPAITEAPAPTAPAITVWPCLRYRDARAALTFLTEVLGFTETLVVDGPENTIEHAELRWPEGGAVMLGDVRGSDEEHQRIKVGAGSVYVVSDRVDEIHRRVTEAGAELTQDLHDTDYGSHGFTVRDTEGNTWSFGTYRGA